MKSSEEVRIIAMKIPMPSADGGEFLPREVSQRMKEQPIQDQTTTVGQK
jgi:hypothetical protein